MRRLIFGPEGGEGVCTMRRPCRKMSVAACSPCAGSSMVFHADLATVGGNENESFAQSGGATAEARAITSNDGRAPTSDI